MDHIRDLGSCSTFGDEDEIPKGSFEHEDFGDDDICHAMIYSFNYPDNKVCWIDARVGRANDIKLNFELSPGCNWCCLPGLCMMISGGKHLKEARKIDVVRDLAVTGLASMNTARWEHSLVLHQNSVFALSGNTSKCEKYLISENRWEDIASIPIAVSGSSALSMPYSNSIYVLGGATEDYEFMDTVQVLELGSLKWKLLSLSLPCGDVFIASFRVSFYSQNLYFVSEEKLYKLSANDEALECLQTLAKSICCITGRAVYLGEKLYCSTDEGTFEEVEIVIG
mmetsp:Transcript_18472/g.33264  ORF Transcript_18472/g.33264 Transcript_18472/m.33264 type:complete len:282 (+) Transcript_18472:170-1015(+)